MPVLPAASRYRKVTVVVPAAKSDWSSTSIPLTWGRSRTGAGSIESFADPAPRKAARAGTAAPRAPPSSVASTEMGAGGMTTGGVTSPTTIAKLPCTTCPAWSPAEQSTVVVPSGKVAPDGGTHVTGSGPSTRSAAVAVNVAMAPNGPVAASARFPGSVRTGGFVSWTVTVKEPLARLRDRSSAEQSTVVMPRENVDPDAGTHATGSGPSTRSVAVAVKLAAAPKGPVASSVRLAGSDRTGGLVSRTATSNEPLATLPDRSLAEQLTVVELIGLMGNVDPDGGTHVTGRGPSKASSAVAVKVTTAPDVPVASIAMFAGSVRTGGTPGWTITVNEPVATCPVRSLA